MSTEQAHRDRAIPAFLDYHYGGHYSYLEEASVEDAAAAIEDIARLYGLTVTVELPKGG